MSGNSPLNISELTKTGIFDEERFFTKISEQCNYVDKSTVKDFYMGLVRTVTQELKENGIVRLPHLGDIALVKQKPKTAGFLGVISAKYIMRFYPKVAWSKYFQKLSEKTGRDGKLDPREKVLNKVL